MNREIKFKVWLGSIRKMTTPFGLRKIQAFIPIFHEGLVPLQFTGQIDVNGKEIYEGDILKESEMSIYQVSWNEKYCKFYLNWENVSPSIQYPEWNRGVKMEIIGNIFENPELLKQ